MEWPDERETARRPSEPIPRLKRGLHMRNIRTNQTGAVLSIVALILAVIGLGLLIVGFYFWTLHPLIWATAIGYTLVGLGALAGIGAVYGPKWTFGTLSCLLVFVGVIILILHYAGFI